MSKMILREIKNIISTVKTNNYSYRRLPRGYSRYRIFFNEFINIISLTCMIKRPKIIMS